MPLSPDVRERLFDSFIYCSNVRELRNLIQDTFAFNAIVNEIEKE